MADDQVSAELAAIWAVTDAATEGPWRAEPNTGAGRVWVQIGRQRHDADCEPLFRVRGGPSYEQRAADAAFIVEARSAMPRLLKVAEAALKLHAGSVNEDYPHEGRFCDECGEKSPCATVRVIECALTGEDGSDE